MLIITIIFFLSLFVYRSCRYSHSTVYILLLLLCLWFWCVLYKFTAISYGFFFFNDTMWYVNMNIYIKGLVSYIIKKIMFLKKKKKLKEIYEKYLTTLLLTL